MIVFDSSPTDKAQREYSCAGFDSSPAGGVPELGCGAAAESGVFDLEMEGASKDLDAGSDGAVDLTREDGRERVPVASDRVGSGGCPPGVAAPWMANSESGCEGIGVFNDATRRSDIALKVRSVTMLIKNNN